MMLGVGRAAKKKRTSSISGSAGPVVARTGSKRNDAVSKLRKASVEHGLRHRSDRCSRLTCRLVCY